MTAATPFYPEHYVIFEGEKDSFLHPALRGCFFVGVLFAFMAGVSVAVWWIDIVSNSNRLALARFSVFRAPLIALEAAFFLAVIIPYATVGDTYAAFIVIPFLVVILVLYVVGARAFHRALSGSISAGSRSEGGAPASPSGGGAAAAAGTPSPDGPRAAASARSAYSLVLRRIEVTAALVIFWLTVEVATLVAEGLLSAEGWQSSVGAPSPTSVPAFIVIYQLIPVFVCAVAWVVARASHENVRLRAARSSRRGCGPCARTRTPAADSSSAPDTSQQLQHAGHPKHLSRRANPRPNPPASEDAATVVVVSPDSVGAGANPASVAP